MPNPPRLSRARTFVALAATTLPLLSQAHAGSDAAAHHDAIRALVAGFVHPLTGGDHLVAALALGAWSAVSGPGAHRAPLAFLVVLAASALGSAALQAAAPGLTLPVVEPLILASLLVFGLLLATRTGLTARAGAAVAGVFALGHGLAHGQEIVGEHALAAVLGLLWASTLLLAAGGALGLLLKRRGDVGWARGAGWAAMLFATGSIGTALWPSATSLLA